MDVFRLSGFLMTTLIHGAVIAGLVAFSKCAGIEDQGPKIGQMVTIEASLAYKSKEKTSKQPQKRRRRARPAPRTEAPKVSRDETRPPEPAEKQPEPQAKPPEEDFLEQFEKFKELRQAEAEEATEGDDLTAGDEPARTGGAFDGSEHGFAEVNKGDPYMRELAGQAHSFWSVPTLEKGSGDAVGCIRVGSDGRIVDTQLLPPTQNATIDAAVRRALTKLTELREQEAKPVPAHLMEATTQWICFKFPY